MESAIKCGVIPQINKRHYGVSTQRIELCYVDSSSHYCQYPGLVTQTLVQHNKISGSRSL